MNKSPTDPEMSAGSSWRAVKTSLIELNKDGLIGVIHAIWESDGEIQQALVARFVPSDRALNKLRRRIMNLVYPNPLGSLPIRVGDALRTIRKFHRASGHASATVALLLDAIEAGSAQANDLGVDDESYYNALAQMMRMLVAIQLDVPRTQRRVVRDRLIRIHATAKNVAWGHDTDVADTLKQVRKLC